MNKNKYLAEFIGTALLLAVVTGLPLQHSLQIQR